MSCKHTPSPSLFLDFVLLFGRLILDHVDLAFDDTSFKRNEETESKQVLKVCVGRLQVKAKPGRLTMSRLISLGERSVALSPTLPLFLCHHASFCTTSVLAVARLLHEPHFSLPHCQQIPPRLSHTHTRQTSIQARTNV